MNDWAVWSAYLRVKWLLSQVKSEKHRCTVHTSLKIYLIQSVKITSVQSVLSWQSLLWQMLKKENLDRFNRAKMGLKGHKRYLKIIKKYIYNMYLFENVKMSIKYQLDFYFGTIGQEHPYGKFC